MDSVKIFVRSAANLSSTGLMTWLAKGELQFLTKQVSLLFFCTAQLRHPVQLGRDTHDPEPRERLGWQCFPLPQPCLTPES